MNTLLGIGVLILVIINFIIYHKLFNVIYFDFSRGCATELFWIVIFTAFEIAIIKGIGQKLLGALGAFFGFVIKLVLILAVIALVIFIVWKIVQMVKSRPDIDKGVGNPMNFAKSAQDMFAKNVSNAEMIPCARCGKTIKKGSKFCQFCGNKIENNE